MHKYKFLDCTQHQRIHVHDTVVRTLLIVQVESLQEKLESLKEEKHRLFQQLKTVLHEEDEKKRQKEQEQKQKYVDTWF